MKLFGNNLKFLLDFHSHSKREIASILQCSVPNLYTYCSGKCEPNYTLLLRMSELFEISVDHLLKTDLVEIYEIKLCFFLKTFLKKDKEKMSLLIEVFNPNHNQFDNLASLFQDRNTLNRLSSFLKLPVENFLPSTFFLNYK